MFLSRGSSSRMKLTMLTIWGVAAGWFALAIRQVRTVRRTAICFMMSGNLRPPGLPTKPGGLPLCCYGRRISHWRGSVAEVVLRKIKRKMDYRHKRRETGRVLAGLFLLLAGATLI